MSMSGEMLGEKTQEKLFGLLLKRDENQVCAECKAKAPTWVSLDFGVFVCMNCSGAHRHLSRNVTRVYSTKIDSWNKSNFQIMDHVGNEIANSYWEFFPPTKRISVNAQPDERVRFVTDKYIRKLYANPKSQNPVITFVEAREKGILERPYQNKENQHTSPGINSIINEKEFNSNGAAGINHIDQLKKQQKELLDKKQFMSMNSPSCKPVAAVSLLDDDDEDNNDQDFLPFQNQPVQQKQEFCLDSDDNTFSNFMQAPQQQQQQISSNQQQGSSLLDMYSNINQAKLNTNNHSKINNLGQANQNPSGMNLNSNNNINNSGIHQSYPFLQQQQQLSNNFNNVKTDQLNQKTIKFNSLNSPNNNSSYNPSSRVNTSACDGTTDLMSLYNKQSNSNQIGSQNYQNGNQSNFLGSQPGQIISSHPPAIQPVDKNRFSALNQMGQYGNNYYPNYSAGYQQQQQYYPGMMPIQQNYQNQWK